MANSFNISVKPEIAAVKADTADIRTDVTAIHDTNLPAVKTDTADIRTDVTAIHNTNLPAVKTDTADIRTDVTAIHDTKLPQISATLVTHKSQIDSIRNETIAIKAITDALPQNVRGKYYPVTLATAESSYQDVCNVSGHGVLFALNFAADNLADTVELLLTIDGNAFTSVTHTGDVISQALVPYSHYIPAAKLNKFPDPPTTISIFSIEFSESLIVQIKRSAGSANTVRAVAHYSLDEF